jgi:hypothetical protein
MAEITHLIEVVSHQILLPGLNLLKNEGSQSL